LATEEKYHRRVFVSTKRINGESIPYCQGEGMSSKQGEVGEKVELGRRGGVGCHKKEWGSVGLPLRRGKNKK